MDINGWNNPPIPWVTIAYDPKNKQMAAEWLTRYMINRTARMFKYTGLPDTINGRVMELYLQCNGYVGIYQHNGDLYAYRGGLGGKPDEYYMPTIMTIDNPAQGLYIQAKIGTDVIVIRNDTTYSGLIPLHSRYASAIAENELSMHIADVLSRAPALISAADDNTYDSAVTFLKNIYDGNLGVIAESAFLEGLRTFPFNQGTTSRTLKDLIECEQYLKASWYNELGLNANWNAKREALNEIESGLNTDALSPLVDDMLYCRQQGVDEVNRMFGTSITVEYDSAWYRRDEAQDLELDQAAADVDATDADVSDAAGVEPTESTDEPTQEQEKEMNDDGTAEQPRDNP